MSYFHWTPGTNTLFYYSFDDSNLNDGSGKGNNGSWYSGVGTYVNGIKGKGVNIAGTRGIQIPIQMINGDFTYSICAYINNLYSPTIQAFLGTVNWSDGGNYMHFHQTNGRISASFSQGQPDSYSTSSSVLQAGVRKNIILTRSGNNWNLYINGTNVLSFTHSFTFSGTGTWTVGCEYTDGRAINGIIDEVILENKAWTQDEITKYVSDLGLSS